jgi:hypothetical protein
MIKIGNIWIIYNLNDSYKFLVHKSCFKCSWCDKEVQIGRCSRDASLESKYGIRYFCRDHMLQPPAKKAEELDKKGITKPSK